MHPSKLLLPDGCFMDLRELKGLEIAARSKIAFADGVWHVPSQTGTGRYKVTPGGERDARTCEDHALTPSPCKHIHAARSVRERDYGGKSPVVVTEPVPKRPTYKRNRPAYNLAQTTEKHRPQVLLSEPCGGVPSPASSGRGRKPAPIPDVLFAMVFKVYTCLAGRRFMCDLEDARDKGHVSEVVHYNPIGRHFENPEFTPILRDPIVRSAPPLKSVGTVFAPDGAGFGVSRFARRYDEKYGVQRSGKDWVKAHAICGVKTNVAVAVEIAGRDAADSPTFKPLVEKAAENFKIAEVPADKAYLSRENLEPVEKLGGTAFAPFRSNGVAGEAGGLWERMFHYFSYRREEFLRHHHARSDIESTFPMLKAKFRDNVRAKTDAATVDEVPCKFICHNICCVIMAQCELGIEAEFWKDAAPAGTPDVLPMVRPG